MGVKISELPVAASIPNAGVLPAVVGGITSKVTKAELLSDDTEGIALVGTGGATVSISSVGVMLVKAASGQNLVIQAGGATLTVDSSGNFGIATPGGPLGQFGADGSVDLTAQAGKSVYIYAEGGAASVQVCHDAFSHPAVQLRGQVEVPALDSASTLGSVVARWPIYDTDGNLIGYAPIYDSIT